MITLKTYTNKRWAIPFPKKAPETSMYVFSIKRHLWRRKKRNAMSNPRPLNNNSKHNVTYLLDGKVSVFLLVLWRKNIKQMCSIVDLLTFLYNSLLYLFKFPHLGIRSKKVTYLALNIETALSSVIKGIAVPIFDQNWQLYI